MKADHQASEACNGGLPEAAGLSAVLTRAETALAMLLEIRTLDTLTCEESVGSSVPPGLLLRSDRGQWS